MKRKTISAMLSVSVAAALLTGCAGTSSNSSSSGSGTSEASSETSTVDYSAIAAQTIAKANTKGSKQNNYDSKVQVYADANTLDSILSSHKNVQVSTQILYDDGSEIDFSKYYDKNGCIYTGSDGSSMVKIGDTVFSRSAGSDTYDVLLDLWPDDSDHSSSTTVLHYGFPQDSEMVFADPSDQNGQVEIEVTNSKTGLQGSLNFDSDSKELTNYFYMVVDPETNEMTITSYNDEYQYDVDEQELPSDLTKAAASSDTYKVTVVFDPSDDNSVTRTYTIPKGYHFRAANGTASDGTYKYELYTDEACSKYYTENSDTDSDMTLYAAKTAIETSSGSASTGQTQSSAAQTTVTDDMVIHDD